MPRWEDLQPFLTSLLGDVLQSVVVVAVTLYLARWARQTFLRAASKSGADINTRHLVARLLYLGILFVGLATVLAIFDIPLSAVVTFVGVIGLSISLALQDILKNFFAGLYLLFERPFRIGEDIRVREFEGRVEDVGVRTITLRTSDNVQVLIPNAMVFAEIVLNRSHARPRASGEAANSHAGAGQPPPVGRLAEALDKGSPPPDVAP